jgi:hypothetical protein
MRALQFWKAVTMDRSDFLERVLAVLDENQIRYCAIGGVGVNAYTEPVVTLDLDIAVSLDDVERAEQILGREFNVRRFAHRVNVSAPGSGLMVQIQTEPEYAAFVDRAQVRDVLGLQMPVAALEDVLQGKIWAAQEPMRRPSKHLKDLSDITRIIEDYPELEKRVPTDVLAQIPQ